MPTRPFLGISLDPSLPAPLQAQLGDALRRLIQQGALAGGAALPSSRDLAAHLQLSRNTVLGALDRLLGEGYVEARPRSGLFVIPIERDTRRRQQAIARSIPASRALPPLEGPIAFRPSQPDVRLFPLAQWNRMRTRALKRHGSRLFDYQDHLTAGLPSLRQRIAEYLRDSRGVRCEWEQVAITSGSQQALHALAQLLLARGDRVLMEDPGYLGAKAAWRNAGARLVPASVDQHGLVLPSRGPAPRLAYLTPSRQFPTGASMPVSRRLEVLAHAARHGSWIIEDDYDSEFRYTSPPLPSMQGLDRSDRVIYVGSMSKVLIPALRIGYVVLPPSLVAPFATLRAVLDDFGPFVEQATLAEFIEAGALFTHIRRCRREYGARLAALVQAVDSEGLPMRFPHVDGGMNLLAVPTAPWPTTLPSRLAKAGLDVPELASFAERAVPPGLVLGFAALTPDEIRAGVTRLAGAFHARR
jgi:GntR family transcriptional regulator/MocR family aminotransferase